MTAPTAVGGRKILVTGATGLLGRPLVRSFSPDDEVWCAARFSDAAVRAEFEAAGLHTFAWDLETGSLTGLPRDFTHVVHGGVVREPRSVDALIAATCRGIGLLMEHCRAVEGFLFVSSAVVYQTLELGHLHTEDDPLGVVSASHWGPAYGLSKISAEGAVRALAAGLGIPSTIARLSVAYSPYAPHAGLPGRLFARMLTGEPVPVQPPGETYCSPIHVDDLVRQVPLLWDAASVPATVVNWGGDDTVTIGEIVAHLSEVTRVPAEIVVDRTGSELIALDPTRRRALIGDCTIPWREGITAAITAHFPDATQGRI